MLSLHDVHEINIRHSLADRLRASRRQRSWSRMASRGSTSLYSEFCVGVRIIGVTMLGVGIPLSCHMTSWGSSSLYSESWIGVGQPTSVVWRADACLSFVRMLCRGRDERHRHALRRSAGVEYRIHFIWNLASASRQLASQRFASVSSMEPKCSSSHYLHSCAAVKTTGVATLGVGQWSWCRMASGGSSSLYSESCVDVATLDVGLPTSWRLASWGSSLLCSDCVGVGTICVRSGCVGLLCEIKRWQLTTSRRSVSSFWHRVACHPEALLRIFVILCRRHDALRRLPASCSTASRGSCSLHLVSWVGVGQGA
jgi:hypothetical protein